MIHYHGMAKYTYRCAGCKRLIYQQRRITDKPILVCQFCGGRLYRIIDYDVPVIFKGKGFYSTDNKGKT